MLDYAPILSIVAIYIIIIAIKWNFYKNNPKFINGKYIFNTPSWMEYLSISMNIIWILIFGYITYYSYINFDGFFQVIFSILLTLFGLYQLRKEFKSRHDEIRLEENQVVISKMKNEYYYEINNIEAVNIFFKKSSRGVITGMKIQIETKDKSDLKEFEVDNLAEFRETFTKIMTDYSSKFNFNFKVEYT